MPQTIPYDPSLVLGNIVNPESLDNLLQIAALQAPVDAANEKMNSLIAMKRSIDMTIDELSAMQIDPSDLKKKSVEVGRAITQAAIEYAQMRLEQEEKVQPLRAKRLGVSQNLESPIDYNSSRFKKLPLSSDSLKLDSQYFSFEGNEQAANASMRNLKSFISASTSWKGLGELSADLSTTAVQQVQNQRERHKVQGTLVITATCTHKQAQIMAPFILDVDKAVRIWNGIFRDDQDKIKMDSVSSLQEIAAEEGTAAEKNFSILSGATFGSSFVGMVHFLQIKETTTSQTMRTNKVMANFQARADVGAWFSKASGGFGLDSSFASDIKSLLSTLELSAHISMVTMGVIPSIKSNDITANVKEMTKLDGETMMRNLNEFSNSAATDMDSMNASADAARKGAQMISLKTAQVNGVMLGLSNIEAQKNKLLNIETLMTSFEDYITKVEAGDHGVPINYFLKNITRAQIAQMWMNKYYPKKYLEISGDDSARKAGEADNDGENTDD